MSGTSLDGLDIACCSFLKKENGWHYTIEAASTIRYSSSLKKKLNSAHTLSGEQLMGFHHGYGKYLGELVKKFIQTHSLRNVDFIASHGHTIFHQPGKGFTFQLGDGQSLFAAADIPVIFDFRSLDVAKGGQGAPLVPIGDQLLFHTHDVCLNLGGIANLSREVNGKRIAFDICFANMGLNYLTQKINKEFDKDGALAAQGEINAKLLTALSKRYDHFRTKRPSLGREDFEKFFLPLLDNKHIDLKDRLRTFTESIALEIASAIGKSKTQSVLLTGGGALNSFLLYRLVECCGDENMLVVPDEEVIKFKEALVFAFLGVLRFRNETNTLKSVTHAISNSSSGVMIGF